MPLSDSDAPGVVLVFGLEPATVSWLTLQLRTAPRPVMAVRVGPDLPPEAAHALVAAADAGVHVVSATRGMDGTYGEYWNLLAEAGKTRFVAVHDLRPHALDVNEVAAIATRVLDEEVLPTTMPLLDDHEGVIGVLDVITGEQWFPDGTRQPARTDFNEAVELETNTLIEASATAGETAEQAILIGAVAPAVTLDVSSRAGVDWLSEHIPGRRVPAVTTVLPGDEDQPLLAAGQDPVQLGRVICVIGDQSQPAVLRSLADPMGMGMVERLEPGRVAAARFEPTPPIGCYLLTAD